MMTWNFGSSSTIKATLNEIIRRFDQKHFIAIWREARHEIVVSISVTLRLRNTVTFMALSQRWRGVNNIVSDMAGPGSGYAPPTGVSKTSIMKGESVVDIFLGESVVREFLGNFFRGICGRQSRQSHSWYEWNFSFSKNLRLTPNFVWKTRPKSK